MQPVLMLEIEPRKNAMSQPFRLLTSSETNEWYTPPDVIALARAVLGTINLDPASCPTAQEIVQAERYFSVEDNGLRWPWLGRVWLNPPYGGNVASWGDKLIYDYLTGRVTEAIMLVSSRPGYDWYENLVDAAIVTCMARKRIPFIKSDGTTPGPARVASTFLYWGSAPDRFRDIFGQVGRIIGYSEVAT